MFAHMSLRRAVIIVAILNGLYFVVEFTMACRTGRCRFSQTASTFLRARVSMCS